MVAILLVLLADGWVRRPPEVSVVKTVALDSAAATLDSGRAYWIPLGRFARGLASDKDGVSQVVLFEDGAELTGRALHAEIRSRGGGLYSHWGDAILFSARDGTDPRTNGHRYEVRLPPAAPAWHRGARIALLAAAMLLLLHWLRDAGGGSLLRAGPRPLGVAAIIVILALRAAFASSARDAGPEIRGEPTAGKTTAYLSALDIAGFIGRGTDFSSPRFDPEGVGKQLGRSVDELKPAFDYDFERLEEVERWLEGVDRERVLAAIFEQVTAGARADVDRHVALADFLARAIHHGPLNPTYRERFLRRVAVSPSALKVEDPLVLLELGEGWCGRAAAVAVDLWRAAGMEGRRVRLGRHIVAELRYDGGWHYLDTDLFGGAEMVRNPDGTIPSLAELSRTPLAIDRPASWVEPNEGGRMRAISWPYPSYYYFGFCPGCEKVYSYKTGSRRQQARDRRFGWREALTRQVAAQDIALSSIPERFLPGAPRVLGVDVGVAEEKTVTVEIRWQPSEDGDGDLAGYRVYVSGQSRGWSYDPEGAVPEVLPYLSHPAGWQPSMYDRLFELPKSEVALVMTEVEQVRLKLEPGHTYYVTVMPFDAHGEAVGREIYCASQELEISL